MEHENEIGFQIQTLSHMIRHMIRHTVSQTASMPDNAVPLSGLQGHIIGYLYDNQKRDVFQRDIQSQFAIRRSTVTGTLQLMEKNGLITRQSVDWDARLKKLELTPRAMEMHEHIIRGLRLAEEKLSSTLAPEERIVFLRLCGKIRDGLWALQSPEKT